MSRQYDEYLEDVGYYESEKDDTEWFMLNEERIGTKSTVLAVNNKGYIAKVTDDGLFPKRLRKGDRSGHKIVRYIGNDGKQHDDYIHRIVAKYFIPNPDNHPNVLHYDDNPDNNNVENLRWGTQKMNHEDCVRNGNFVPISEECRRLSIEACRRPIYAITPKGTRLYFNSIRECCETLHVHSANVDKVLKGERPHTMGYRFERADEDE